MTQKTKPEFNNVEETNNKITSDKFTPEQFAEVENVIKQKQQEREAESLPRKERKKKSALFNNR